MKTGLIILALTFSGLLATEAKSNETTDTNWAAQLKKQSLSSKDQAYCYTDEAGELQGKNVDLRIRLASVSKLITTLWAIDKLGLNYKYNTKLYIKDNNLHIEGSYDPYLGNEKMFYLLSQLNELGYNKFDTITFDKNVIINPDVAYGSDEYPTINATTMTRFIKNYFNTKSWSADSRQEYANFSYLSKAGKYLKEVSFEASNVKMVEANPFAGDETVKVLTLSSPELYRYLKHMNIKSNNYVAETVFRQIGGASSFPQYLKDRFDLAEDKIYFYSGSGLPTFVNGDRKDNYATCSIALQLITELKNTVDMQKGELEDVVAVPGSDGGTFRNRIISADYKNSFVAKTGTLMHTSALAGAMNTQKGFSYFGIFNQSTNISGSKVVQNSMVKSIMTEMGGPKAFNYEVKPFHAYGSDNVKGFDLENEDEDFTSIDKGLF